MSVSIKKAGVLDTFQDLGRNGFRKLGINPNGAMDKTAVRLINILLGNNENEAVLEMHFPASEIKFEEETVFAFGGANFGATLSNKRINNWQIQRSRKGQLLKFPRRISGNRCYLAIKGGFKIDKWLGSASTNLTVAVGGFKGRKICKDDSIRFNLEFPSTDPPRSTRIARSVVPHYSNSPTVRMVKGAEYPNLTALSEQILLSSNYKITQDSNRMGFRLEGKAMHLLDEKDLISTAVNFGTIQLLPNGQMIVLMADHQTAGGYPRIAHIIEKDLPLIAQLGAGDSVGIHLISLEKAEELNIEFEKDLDFLKMGVKFSQNLK